MHRRDQIDADLAKHFAWSFALPADADRLAEDRLRAAGEAQAAAEARPIAQLPPAAATTAAGDDLAPAEDPSRARSHAACRALAAAVGEAWGLDDEEARLRAIKRLLSRADRLGFELVSMAEWPLEAVRLMRLLVAYAPKTTARQRERIANVARYVPLEHPETAELLVEIARAGERSLVEAIFGEEEDWMPEVGDVEALVARLADVLDDGPNHASRMVAIAIIECFEPRDAAFAALRRALRLPSFGVRARALHALATGFLNGVEPNDLVQVLRDLVDHAPPDSLTEETHEQNEQIFAEGVLAALENVQPDAAAELLLDWIDAEHEALWLDDGWATEALAVAFPDTSAAMVEHWLRCTHAHDRYKAMAALERLPLALAEGPLRALLRDPSAMIRDRARRVWLDRFERARPSDVEGLIGAGLLEGPPSDRFAARLAVVHGRVPEARQAMARVLLAEAPAPGAPPTATSREALVLLLQLVADDTESHEPLGPASKGEGLAMLVAERFGALAVEGLCAIAARFPEPESFGWMHRLGDLVEKGAISRDHAAPLRALAARHVASDDGGQIGDALRLLGLVGAPPEILDRVLGVALEDDSSTWEARKLLVAWPDRALDTRLVSEMAVALAERDWTRLQGAAWMALGRRAPAAHVIAQRVLEVAEQDEDALDAAIECARGLRQAGALTDAWALAALAHPESPLFSVAARAWHRSPEVRPALEAALASAAREGISAAEAAVALLHGDPPMSPRDRRLTAVLAGALAPWRAELVHAMAMRGAPLPALAPHLEKLLTSPEPEVTQPLQGIAIWLKSPRARTLLRSVLPRVVDGELRAEIEEELGAAPEPYWVEG